MPGTPLAGFSKLAGEPKTARLPSQPAEVDQQYTLADVDPIGRWEGIIAGGPGSGKTVVAAGFPSPFRWLASDGKTAIKSLRWAYKEGMTSLTKMEDLVAYTPVETMPDDSHYAAKANAFNKMTDMVDHWFSPGEVEKWEGGTLVLDSASQINEWSMNLSLNINGQFPTKDKPLSTSNKVNEAAKLRILTGQQDYKSAMALFESFIADTRQQCDRHNRNLVLLTHLWIEDEKDPEKDSRRIVGYKPWFYGQLRDQLPKLFDDVWFMQVYNGKEFKVQVHADPKYDAKTRWGQCLQKEEVADYKAIIKKVKDYHELPKAQFDAKYNKK